MWPSAFVANSPRDLMLLNIDCMSYYNPSLQLEPIWPSSHFQLENSCSHCVFPHTILGVKFTLVATFHKVYTVYFTMKTNFQGHLLQHQTRRPGKDFKFIFIHLHIALRQIIQFQRCLKKQKIRHQSTQTAIRSCQIQSCRTRLYLSSFNSEECSECYFKYNE